MSEKDSHPENWKEARRKCALELKECGWKQIRIAEALGVSRAAVSQWIAAASQRGPESWRAKPRPCGPLKLTREQLDSIPQLLSQGAEAYGFLGDVWTCARVASVIRSEWGVSYHKAHVSRLLKDLGWTPQKPIERATQRDETLIQQWRTDVWPELKKRRAGMARPLCSWMSRVSICCQAWFEPMLLAVRRPSCGVSRPVIICP